MGRTLGASVCVCVCGRPGTYTQARADADRGTFINRIKRNVPLSFSAKLAETSTACGTIWIMEWSTVRIAS